MRRFIHFAHSTCLRRSHVHPTSPVLVNGRCRDGSINCQTNAQRVKNSVSWRKSSRNWSALVSIDNSRTEQDSTRRTVGNDDAHASTTSLLLPETPAITHLLQEAGISRDYIEELGRQNPTPLRLKDMYEYGSSNDSLQRLRNAQFLHRELPVRIAHRAIDLLTSPHGLSDVIPIRQVATIYLTFLRRLYEYPLPTNVEQEERFTDMLQTMILDRTSIPTSIAQGVESWWQRMQESEDGKDQQKNEDRLRDMDQALARFFTARVGLRFLVEQYVLTSPRESAQLFRKQTGMLPVLTTNNTEAATPQQRLGCIQPNVDVAQEVRRIADVVSMQTKEYYNGLCPDIHIIDCSSDYDEFTFVPHHLQYMVSELLKNSCRASVRRYKERTSGGEDASKFTIPSIRVVIVKGSEDVTVKVADQGGGIPRSRMATIWRFAHSTAHADEQQTTFGVDTFCGARLRGFGLPLAEIYARYFGGELTLKSTEGYGLDAYLHLPRLGDACENLPLRVRDSPAGGVSLPTFAEPLAARPRTQGTRSIRSGTRMYSPVASIPSTVNSSTVAASSTAPLGALDLAARRKDAMMDARDLSSKM
jgi:pyruvate dehydrogenase kinase 2/3/4